jgi:hypothetical protein
MDGRGICEGTEVEVVLGQLASQVPHPSLAKGGFLAHRNNPSLHIPVSNKLDLHAIMSHVRYRRPSPARRPSSPRICLRSVAAARDTTPVDAQAEQAQETALSRPHPGPSRS